MRSSPLNLKFPQHYRTYLSLAKFYEFFLENSVLFNLSGEAVGYSSYFVTAAPLITTSAAPIVIDNTAGPGRRGRAGPADHRSGPGRSPSAEP